MPTLGCAHSLRSLDCKEKQIPTGYAFGVGGLKEKVGKDSRKWGEGAVSSFSQ